MIRIRFLGTCSGTEPMPGRHHSAVVLEVNGFYYWFDAGENCSHFAYTSGIDMTHVRAIFISHMHIDHIGGLANLFFTIAKVEKMQKLSHINGNSYDVFAPDLQKLQAVKLVSGISSTPAKGVRFAEHEVRDGVIFADENVRVTALHNAHLKETGENGFHSYSYLIESEGKRIVYSGDVATPSELDPYVTAGCDLLMMETGHHKVSDVCGYVKERGISRVLFTHHGREILRDPDAAASLSASMEVDARICNDGDVEVL